MHTTPLLAHSADDHACTRGSIEWPDFVLQAMSALKNFAQMNPITLNGLSCVFYGVDFYQQLYSYTLGLLGLVAILLFPVPCAYLRGFQGHDEHHVRWRQTLGNDDMLSVLACGNASRPWNTMSNLRHTLSYLCHTSSTPVITPSSHLLTPHHRGRINPHMLMHWPVHPCINGNFRY